MFRDNEMRRYAAAVFIVLLIAVGAGFAASGLFEGKTEPDTTAPTGDATAETAFRSTPIMPAASTPTPRPTPQTRETLAFIRDEDVWLVGADGTELRRLTHFAGSGRKVSFLWAPTGLEMVLAAGFVEKDSTAAPIFELATTEGKVLWRKEELGLTGVHWSLDGRLVAMFADDAVRIESRDGRLIWTGNGKGASYVDWSNDSVHFAIVDGSEIQVVADDGSASRLDVGPPLDACSREQRVLGRPLFTRDDKSLIVPVGCDAWHAGSWPQRVRLYVASLDGSVKGLFLKDVDPPGGFCAKIFGLVTPAKDCLTLGGWGFSPDGNHVGYLEPDRLSCTAQHRLLVFDADGGNLQPLLAKGLEAPITAQETARRWYGAATIIPSYAWSPLGDAVVASFIATDTCTEGSPQNAATYLFRLDGSVQKLLDEAGLHLSWSSSGDMLAYEVESRDGPQIRILNLNNGTTQTLGPGASPEWRPR